MHVAVGVFAGAGGGSVGAVYCVSAQFKWSDTSGSPPNFLACHSSLTLPG